MQRSLTLQLLDACSASLLLIYRAYLEDFCSFVAPVATVAEAVGFAAGVAAAAAQLVPSCAVPVLSVAETVVALVEADQFSADTESAVDGCYLVGSVSALQHQKFAAGAVSLLSLAPSHH